MCTSRASKHIVYGHKKLAISRFGHHVTIMVPLKST